MEKALDILYNIYFDDRNIMCIEKSTAHDVFIAIKELEKAMKPKSCDSCRSELCSVKRILLERGEMNSSYFYCNDYEPKDNK